MEDNKERELHKLMHLKRKMKKEGVPSSALKKVKKEIRKIKEEFYEEK